MLREDALVLAWRSGKAGEVILSLVIWGKGGGIGMRGIGRTVTMDRGSRWCGDRLRLLVD